MKPGERHAAARRAAGPGTPASGRRQQSRAERARVRAELAAAADLQTVLDAAAAFLGTRMRSVVETRRRLSARGYPVDLVEAALTRLTELGYLDDRAFARAWVESRDRARPRGEAALRRELAARGVASDVIAGALAERGGPAAGSPEASTTAPASADETAALRLLERRGAALARDADARRRRRRAYALLARNGFDADVCRSAVARWSDALGSSEQGAPDEDTFEEGPLEP